MLLLLLWLRLFPLAADVRSVRHHFIYILSNHRIVLHIKAKNNHQKIDKSYEKNAILHMLKFFFNYECSFIHLLTNRNNETHECGQLCYHRRNALVLCSCLLCGEMKTVLVHFYNRHVLNGHQQVREPIFASLITKTNIMLCRFWAKSDNKRRTDCIA